MQSEQSCVVDDPRFPPPWVEGSLESLTGATNVLLVTLLQAPLRVEVTPWPESPQDDYFIEVPTLHLRVTAYNGVVQDSAWERIVVL
ncbi:hypothetical protein D3C81_1165730 [compost metagenome]|jgi:hypothetical protein